MPRLESRIQPGRVVPHSWSGELKRATARAVRACSAYLVNTEWLAEQKAAAKGTGETGFVSSNDVLTSWFLSTGKYDSGCMVFNLRDRIPGYDSTHAGNYQSMIHYWPEVRRRCVTQKIQTPEKGC